MPTPISARIERIQEGFVFLALPDGQTVHLPENAIRGTLVAGNEIRLLGFTPPFEASSDTFIAHSLLNELLGTSS